MDSSLAGNLVPDAKAIIGCSIMILLIGFVFGVCIASIVVWLLMK